MRFKKFLWTTLLVIIFIAILLESSLTIWSFSQTASLSPKKEKSNIIVLCQINNNEYNLNKKNTLPKTTNTGNTESNAIEVIFPTFKETVETDKNEHGKFVINNPDSLLLLVNKDRMLPVDFVPTQLITPDIRFVNEQSKEKNQMKAIAALALEELFKEAEVNGHYLFGVSGYRSYSRQKNLYQSYVKKNGKEQADTFSATPGTSEHQSGLAMDISVESQKFELTEAFGKTPEGIWVKDNAHKFGFIIRYPQNKTSITGYVYEPWHLRFIGKEHALYVHENNLVLEEIIKK